MNYVWCTLVMIGDSYARGAAVVARTLRNVGTKYPIWCMVGDGVSSACEEFLRTQFDAVVVVPTITHKVAKMRSRKQASIYGSWIHASFTKWHILDPKLFPVDKVILLDADMMFLENCDDLFDLPAPALTFSSPWVRSLYGELKHGQVVKKELIRRSLQRGIVGLACMVLVRPSTSSIARMWEILQSREVYGNSRCTSGFDEQLIAEVLLGGDDPIHHIYQQYNWIVGKFDWLRPGEKPKTQQFYNGKPWTGITSAESRAEAEKDSWDDVIAWWKVADQVMDEYPEAHKWFYPDQNSK